MDLLAQIFQQELCFVKTFFQNGVRIFLTVLAVYNVSVKTQFSIYARHHINRTQQTGAVIKIFHAASRQHITRVHYQIQAWLGNNLELQNWGCVKQN